MVSRAGLTVRFAESDVRSMGRDTTGVRGMDVGKDGQVIAMDVARDDMDLLVVTENGYGKRTPDRPVPQDQPRRQRRQDDRPDREKGRPRGRARRARAPGAGVHQRRRHGPAHRRRRHLPAGPLGHRRARDEPQGRRPRQRRRARRRRRRRRRSGRRRGRARARPRAGRRSARASEPHAERKLPIPTLSGRALPCVCASRIFQSSRFRPSRLREFAMCGRQAEGARHPQLPGNDRFDPARRVRARRRRAPCGASPTGARPVCAPPCPQRRARHPTRARTRAPATPLRAGRACGTAQEQRAELRPLQQRRTRHARQLRRQRTPKPPPRSRSPRRRPDAARRRHDRRRARDPVPEHRTDARSREHRRSCAAAVLCLINQRARRRTARAARGQRASFEQAAEEHSPGTGRRTTTSRTSPRAARRPVDRIRDDRLHPEPRRRLRDRREPRLGHLQLSTPQAIVAAWIASPGHLANILEAQYDDTGIGITPAVPPSLGAAPPGATYAQEFGVIVQLSGASSAAASARVIRVRYSGQTRERRWS